jgi:hypothetical protein
MYPIDAIKVGRKLYPILDARSHADNLVLTDTNANNQSDSLRSVQWNDPRDIQDSHW